MDTTTVTPKQRIKDALVKFIKDGQFPHVTVSELCNAANVGKSTFYRSFHDIYEVFESLTDDFLARCVGMAGAVLIEKRFTQEQFFEFLSNPNNIEIKLPFSETDEIVFNYIYKTLDFQLIQTVYKKIVKMLFEFEKSQGMDDETAQFYAVFVASACILDTTTKYKRRSDYNFSALSIGAMLLRGDSHE